MAPHRILLVDDHRDVIRLLHSSLDTLEQEFEIVEAPSAEEAMLEIFNKIDLLVLDYMLPGMTGLEFLAKIAKRQPETKVILITGTTDKKARKKILEAGAFAFFEKPVSLTDFLDAVERALGLTRTILPPEWEPGQVEQHKTISGMLSKFRQGTNADAVFLVSDHGTVLVRAGELSDSSLEVSLLAASMAIINASYKMSRYIHQDVPLSYHAFQGGDQDLLLLPVDAGHSILVSGERIVDRNVLQTITDAAMILRSEVEHILTTMGVAKPFTTDAEITLTVPEEMIEDEISSDDLNDMFKTPIHKSKPEEKKAEVSDPDDEFRDMFSTSNKKKTSVADSDAFWDDAVKEQSAVIVDADKLSYEQAQQLGFTPEDD